MLGNGGIPMVARPGLRVRARMVALLTAVVVVGAGFAGTAHAATRTQKVLGTKNAAKGTPVTIGVISNGKTPTVDQSDEKIVAAATAKWINEFQGGLGGRPMEIKVCEDAG